MHISLWQQSLMIATADKIRYPEEPQSPELLKRWLNLPPPGKDKAIRVRHYQDQCQLLSEAINDQSLPESWRRLCLSQLPKPKMALFNMTHSANEASVKANLWG